MVTGQEIALIDHTAYKLQIALTEAIGAYVMELRDRQYRALTYRGIDMGRALSVELYFRLINDLALRDAYKRSLDGEELPPDPDAIPVSTEAYWILRQMIGRKPRFSRPRMRDYRDLSQAMRRRHLAPLTGRSPHRKGPPLFLALSKRFYDYLRPIRDALAGRATWLIPSGSDWEAAIARDGDSCRTFGYPAMPRGDLTSPLAAYWPDLAGRFDSFVEILEQLNPSAVVMTEGNHCADELMARAAEMCGVRSVCIQQGWSPIVHAGFRNMRYDAFCVWGKGFAELLKPYNRRQPFRVTGSHRLAPTGLSPRPGALAFFLQKGSLLLTDEACAGMLAFINWSARQWPERKILVREHPAAPLTPEEKASLSEGNIVFCPSGLMSLDAILGQTEIAVAFYSTTLVEALAYGAVPLIINLTGMPRYNPDLEMLGAGVEAHDFDAARAKLTDLLSGESRRIRPTAIANRFFAHPADQALCHLAAAIVPGH